MTISKNELADIHEATMQNYFDANKLDPSTATDTDVDNASKAGLAAVYQLGIAHGVESRRGEYERGVERGLSGD